MSDGVDMQLYLTLQAGERVAIKPGKGVRIGRAPDNDLVVARASVSGYHAAVEYHRGFPRVYDRGSKNGVTVNGVRVGEEGITVALGDEIVLGDAVITVVDAAGRTQAPISLMLSSTVNTTASLMHSSTGGWHEDRSTTEYLLGLLLRAGALANEEALDPQAFLRKMLELAMEALPGQRGAAFLVGTSGPMPVAFRDRKGSTATFQVPSTVLSAALSEGRSVLMSAKDIHDPASSMVRHGIGVAIAVPISSGANLLGALYLDDGPHSTRLGSREMELATVLATQAGLTYENQRLAGRAMENERYAMIGLSAAETAHDLAAYFTRIRCAEYLFREWLTEKFPQGPDTESWQMLTTALDSTYRVLEDLRRAWRQKTPNWTPAGVRETLESVVSVCTPLAQTRGVKLVAACHVKDEDLEFDPAWIERALVNLVRNAIEVSDRNAEVTVGGHVELDGKSLSFWCRDQGPGIRDEDRARIFEPYYTSGKPGGTGLGLAIAHRIAQAHEGTLSVTTEVGSGSVFSLRIPVRREQETGGRLAKAS